MTTTLTYSSSPPYQNNSEVRYVEEDIIPNSMWKNKRFLDMYKSLVNSLHLQIPDMSAPDAAIKEFQASMKTCALEAYNYLKGDSNFHLL